MAAPVLAQEAPPAGDAAQPMAVTGSLIAQPLKSTSTSVISIGAEELALEGTTNVETLLNNLPLFSGAQTEEVAGYGTSGTATANLLNLGTFRTLVLIDGRRAGPGDPGEYGEADLNTIPAALVERVDVLTGGASAAYGSGAEAGVVNFVLKKDFQGFQLDAQSGFYNHDSHDDAVDAALAANNLSIPGSVSTDGSISMLSALFGSNFADGRGNITAYAGLRKIEPILEGARDFSDCAIGTSGSNNQQHVCASTSNTAYGRFDNTGPAGNIEVMLNPNGTPTFVPYAFQYAYNYTPQIYLQRADDTYHAGLFGHLTLTPQVELYADGMFTADSTVAQNTPSGIFRGSGPDGARGYTFNCNNPLISAAEVAQLCPGATITPGAAGGAMTFQSIGYRFAALPEDHEYRHADTRLDVGLRGELSAAWHYDVSAQYSISSLSAEIMGAAWASRVQNALNVVDVNNVPTCSIGAASGCAPLNIFTALGAGFTPAALRYVTAPVGATGQTAEQSGSVNLTGDLGQLGFQSPLAVQGVKTALGAEFRRDEQNNHLAAELMSGDLTGIGAASAPAFGAQDEWALYGEAQLPLIQERPWVQDLSASLDYRFSDYIPSGVDSTWGANLHYSPISDVGVRVGFNLADRAPSLTELYTPTVLAPQGYQDPCEGASPVYTQAQCVATGLNPALYGHLAACPVPGCNAQYGGNAALRPEIEDAFTLGLQFTPRWISGFDANVELYYLKVRNLIGPDPLNANTIIYECVSVDAYCGQIHRDANGMLDSATGYVAQTAANTGTLMTRGGTLTVHYETRFADWRTAVLANIPGSLVVNLIFNDTRDLTYAPTGLPGSGDYNCVGLYGETCGVPQPTRRSVLRLTWLPSDAWTLSLNWRHLGAVLLDLNSPNPYLYGGAAGIFNDSADERIPGYNYLDLAASYRIRGRYALRAGINNLADKDPPVVDSAFIGLSVPPFGNGNTFPGTYDALGRQFFFAISADL